MMNRIMAALTFVLLGCTALNLFMHLSKKPAKDVANSTATTETDSAPAPKVQPDEVASANRSILRQSGSMISGVGLQVPLVSSYPIVKAVPWNSGDVARLFRDAGSDRSCRLLETNVPVVQALNPPADELSGPLGRTPVFSIRLEPSKDAEDPLSGVVRGVVEDYLRSHHLTIQTQIYANERGEMILGPTVKAAFVRSDQPEKTVMAESMIATSIGELRTLGASWESSEPFSPEAFRTLILAFRYTRDALDSTQRKTTQRDYELVFIHRLPGATFQDPRIVVFATSDGRTKFQLLEPINGADLAGSISILADVRFQSANMMGMYPEAPVVTGVRHASLLSVSSDLVKSQMDAKQSEKKNTSFSELLDEFYRKAMDATGSLPVQESATEQKSQINASADRDQQ
jgi:hypothetical protein